ncbi:MAG: ABC transporter permease [Bryobacterales bacterium]|nr:ABC transporter permease [Bryobacterales bacterium]MBV9401030.1 ABC transporter permease [Bryobacterales bacterium]
MDAELRDHLAARAQDLISRGIPPAEAELQARREFGAIESIKDDCRQAKGFAGLDALARDFRFAVRVLRKSPAYTITAIATLALCIGANTAIFSIVDSVLFRPLPYPEPDRLAWVSELQHTPDGDYEETAQNGRRWEFLRDNVRTMDIAVYASGSQGVNLAPPGMGAQYVKQQRVSAGFFRVLGVAPLIGREIQPVEDVAGGPAVAVLSHSLWRRAFASDRAIVGRKILLRGEPYTVIGIMPSDFRSVPPAELWTPLRPSTTGEGGGANYSVIARLKPGFRRQDGQAELAALSGPLFSRLHLRPGIILRMHLVSVQRGLSNDLRTPLLLLWFAVGLVLLIGCVNVASLALARSGTRRHEIATRIALGSGRGAILRQLLSESLLMAIAGATAGLAIGYAALAALKGLLYSLDAGFPDTSLLNQPLFMDARLLLVTAATALLTALVFGLYPGVEATRVDVRNALASWGRTATRRQGWVRRSLVVCEVALGMVLLVSAGVVVRTLALLAGLTPGFDAGNVLTARLSLQDARYTTAAQVNRLFDDSLSRIRDYPGVEAAGIGLTLPYERALNEGARVLDGSHPMQNAQTTNVTYVTPGYFETLRITLQRGRLFDQRDSSTAAPVAIVNDAYVHRYIRDSGPVGMHVAFGDGKPVEIVGVVADVQEKRAGWGDFGPIGPIPDIYVPAAQFSDAGFRMVHTWFTPKWVVRASAPRAAMEAAMQQSVASVDPQLPFAEFRTMDEVRSAAFGMQRLQTTLLSSLAGLALLLSAVGIYGIIAHSVIERTREFGIRIALGSSHAKAISAAARPGIALAAIGVAAGLLLSFWARKLISTLIWGVRPDDAITLAGVSAILLAAAVAAALIPSLRIARIDPAMTLREE